MNDEKNLSPGKSLNIFTIGEQVLRAKTRAIDTFDKDLENLVHQMLKCMYDNEGIGLAAPQVGYSEKICVIDVSPCISEGDICTMDDAQVDDIRAIMPLFLINPVITHKSLQMSTKTEGCLSIPEFSADVRRPEEVTVQFLDITGKQHIIAANAILGRCMQHEIDHLNGRLYTDLISKLDKLRLAKYLAEHSK